VRVFVAALALAGGLVCGPAWAEVYTWTDGEGRVHMTDDLSTIPKGHRDAAVRGAREEVAPPKGWNPLDTSGAWKRSAPATARRRPGASPRVHVLSVERAGSSMRVLADLDGSHVPFIVDTGAMGCTIPAWAVAEMGIEIDKDTPRMLVQGISGQPMLVPVIRVGTVDVGGASVDDVEMAVLATQQVGLLGMTFFNHFRVSTDPARGTLTLEEIDLDTVDGVYGGMGERAWRNKFAYVQSMLDTVQIHQSHAPSGFSDYERELEEAEAYWEHQLDELETRASRAGVPRAWRE
jgi:hypothetical protein